MVKRRRNVRRPMRGLENNENNLATFVIVRRPMRGLEIGDILSVNYSIVRRPMRGLESV